MKNVSPELIGLTNAPGASPIEKQIATLLALNLEVLLDVQKDLRDLFALLGDRGSTVRGGDSGDRPVRGDQQRDQVQVRRPDSVYGKAIPASDVLPGAGNKASPRRKRTSK